MHACMHAYDHIAQQIHNLSDTPQQHTLHSMEQDASLFATDSTDPCYFNITNQDLDTNSSTLHNNSNQPQAHGIHALSKHKYRNTFGEANTQHHNFDNCDSLTFKDKFIHCIVTTGITKPLLVFT